MREYAKFAPTFWTRGSGKLLRGYPEAQVVATYLFSAPGSNMIGLYYLPMPTLAHETGLSSEGASKGLRRVIEAGIAHYDDDAELVWMPEAARIQMGQTLQRKDKRSKGVLRELTPFGKHAFVGAFLHRYGDAYHIEIGGVDVRPLEGPSKVLRSQEQEQEQEIDQKSNSCEVETSPDRESPELEVFEHWKTVMQAPRAKLDDKRRRIIKLRLKDFSTADLKRAIDGCKNDPFSMGDNDRAKTFNGIHIICRDAEHVEKFIALTEPAAAAAIPRVALPLPARRFASTDEGLGRSDFESLFKAIGGGGN